MKQVSYNDFSARINNLSPGKRIPQAVSLELTYRCNSRCVHCFCNLPAQDSEARNRELTTGEVKGLLDGLAAMGTLWLLITGGEPLLRDDFKEIYLYAKDKGFLITLFTNGTLLSREHLALLKRHRPFVVEVSLYGATREVFEQVTGVAGSHERCLRGIRQLLEAGLKVKLKSVAITANAHEIPAMESLARDLGCDFRYDPLIQARIDDREGSFPADCRLPATDVVRLDLMFPKRLEAYREFCDAYLGRPRESRALYRCGAGMRMMHVNPYGEAMGCMLMVRDAFSLRERGLDWVWETGIPSVIGREKDFAMPCDDCRLYNLCDQCPAWSILEHGDEKKELTFICEIAKKRAERFDFVQVHSQEREP